MPFLNAQVLSLDGAVAAARFELSRDLELGSVVAIINFASPSEDLSLHVVDELTAYLVQSRQFRVVDRSLLDMIREEQNFQMSGEVSDESMRAIGRMLGAQYIITGSFSRSGQVWRFGITSLNVETAQIESAFRTDVAEDPQIIFWTTGVWPHPPNSPHLWTLGVSGGSSFAAPWAIITIHATIAPFRHSFFEIGCDVGLVSGQDSGEYYSVMPFAHYAYFQPFAKKGGWYIGAGGGWMYASYTYDDLVIPASTFALSATTGFNIGNFFNISYTLRTNFKSVNNKVSLGFVYRFRKEESP